MQTETVTKETTQQVWNKRPLIISGPCSAETVEQVLATAQQLAATGKVDMLRAGIWKPRTKPGMFECIGARNTVNPFSVQEVADALRGVDVPVLIKNPINPDLELWSGAIERIARA